MAEAGISRKRKDRRKEKNAQHSRNSQEFIDLHQYVNSAKRPDVDPRAEAGLFSRVEKEQRYIADRARGGTVPLPIRINAFRHRNTSFTEIHHAEKSIQTTGTDDGRVAENWVNHQPGQGTVGLDLKWRPNPAKRPNPSTRPAINPRAEAGLISRVEREQRHIADRARGGTAPLPIRINAFGQRNTSRTEIYFAEKSIQTTVTDDGRVAENWVNQQTGQEIVGFDLEWRPNFQKGSDNPTALLQLCTDKGCLIIQMLFSDFIPEALVRFLKDPGVKIVGVGIENDVTKLRNDHRLECGGQLELGALAAERLERPELKKVGLKGLAMEVLGLTLLKPKNISMSNWACRTLQERQIRYACIDAYVSFAIGKKLLEPEN